MRIDKFLKVSRILKRRTVAAGACDGERVFVNGKIVKPAHKVKIGDVVKIQFNEKTLVFKVMSLNEKASKDESASLYEIIGDDVL